jgi:hypothetical protein
MLGRVFGKLRVVALARIDDKHQKYWDCNCECGGSKVVRNDKLTSGTTRSCGCLQTSYRKALQVEASSEARKYTRNSYKSMLSRCYRLTSGAYLKYGAKGVDVCDRWRYGDGVYNGWTCFYLDMGPRPVGTSLDRVDNTKGYSPDNCRWATASEQNTNRRFV